MNFELTSDQKLLRETVRSFTKQRSPVSRFRELRAANRSFDPAVWAHMGELGWLSIPIAEAAGGFGGDMVDVAILLEAFGASLVPEPYIPSVVMAGLAIAWGGDTSSHERFLRPMIAGRTVLSFAHAERNNRFGGAVESQAQRQDEDYHLRGTKTFVPFGQDAAHIVVSAATSEGLGLFVVDRDMDGVALSDVRTIDGHGAAVLELDVVLDPTRLLGRPGEASELLLDRVLDHAAAAACAEALGVAQTSLEMTRDHLRTREQFGVPIGSFQSLQHRAVDMFVQVELMRSMAILASIAAGDADATQRRLSISAAKAQVASGGRFVTQQAIQLHGGIGITDEHDIGLYFKRMHTLGLVGGDEDHHLRRYANSPRFAPPG